MAKTSKRNTRGFRSDVMDLAQDRPIATAAAAAAAVGAGVFLWSRRTQISNQLSDLSDQITEWAENMRSGSSGDWSQEDDMAGTTTLGQASTRSAGRTSSSERGISETGGGNASLGRQSGGGGTTGSGSGRRRVRPAPTT